MGPLFLSNDQETPCPEKHEHDRRSEVAHHVIGKLFPQGRDIVLEYHMAYHPMLLQETSCLFQMLVPTRHISVNRCCLVWISLINLVLNTGVGFQLC